MPLSIVRLNKVLNEIRNHALGSDWMKGYDVLLAKRLLAKLEEGYCFATSYLSGGCDVTMVMKLDSEVGLKKILF